MKLCICDVSKEPLLKKQKIIKDIPIFYYSDKTDTSYNLEILKQRGYKINSVKMIIEIPNKLVIAACRKTGKNPIDEIYKMVGYYRKKMLDKL